MRKVALVCLSPPFDADEMPLPMPSYGIHRIHAAALSAAEHSDAEVRLFDMGALGYTECLKELRDFAPDVAGYSVYVWSLDPLLDLANALSSSRPEVVTVFGGPSARRACLALPYYAGRAQCVDMICEGDGEVVIQALLERPQLDPASLSTVPGLHVLDEHLEWKATPAQRLKALDSLPSPYQLGLMPEDAVAYLETYRGCPLSCRFCAWGKTRPAREVFSMDYIARELASFRGLGAPAVFLLDAGLNLNAKAFRNLSAAQDRDGFLSEALFWAEIYPTIIKPEHIEFLASVGTAYLGVGLQSIDPWVLKAHDRPFDMKRFASSISALSQVAGMEIQIIMGLPEDTPEGFRRTLDFALSLPVNSVRVYHCLVLPDALLSRGQPSWKMEFDPVNLTMKSNHTWSATDLAAMRQELNVKLESFGGNAGEYWWAFRV